MSKHGKRHQLAQSSQQQTTAFQIRAAGIHFSGPVPHPDILIKYNSAHPQAAERILAMAEKQAAHRQELEKTVVAANCHSQKTGPIYGFIVCMTAILCGSALIYVGKNAAGLTAIISALGSLALVFIVGKTKQKQELQAQADALTKQP